MENIKFYSSKSNAKRAAKAAGFDIENCKLVEKDEQYAYVPVAQAQAEEDDLSVSDNDARLISICGESHCPGCGIHLDNGICDYASFMESNPIAAREMTHNWECLACGHQFGEEIVHAKPDVKSEAQGTGIKIEKNREERNGMTRPSIGGVCREIWDACDELYVDGKVPSLKEMKKVADAKGWSHVTTSVQYYQWRKFHGVRGRQ